MELIIGVIAIAVVGYFMFFRKEKDTSVYAATPVPAQDIAPQPVPVEEKPTVAIVEGAGAVEIPAAPEKKTRKPRAAKAEKPAAKKAAAKKPAAKKTAKKSKNA